MRTTPTGQRTGGDDPSTMRKEVLPGQASPNGKDGPSPAPTQARARSPGAAGGRPPTGKGGKGGRRNRNPLSEAPSDHPVVAAPPPTTTVAEDEAALVGDTPLRRGDGSEFGGSPARGGRLSPQPVDGGKTAEVVAPGGADNDTTKGDGSRATAEQPQAITGSRRVLRTNVALLVLAVLPLVATIVLAALQGAFVEERSAFAANEATIDALCLGHAAGAFVAVSEESYAAEELTSFHMPSAAAAAAAATATSSANTPANASSPLYREARMRLDAAVESTDGALKAFLGEWAHESVRLHETGMPPDVRGLRDAPSTSAGLPWVTQRGFATRFKRRVDFAVASSVPNHVLDLDSLDRTRLLAYAGAPTFRTSAAYSAFARSVGTLCAGMTLTQFGNRHGDAAALAASGAIAHGVSAAAIMAAVGSASLSSGVTIRKSGGSLDALYAATGARGTARSWPMPAPALGTPSRGVQAALPFAVADNTSTAYAAVVARLNPAQTRVIRTAQRVMLGRLGSFVSAARDADKGSNVAAIALASRIALWCALAFALLGLLTAVVFAAVEVMHRDRYDMLDRELDSVSRAVDRMRYVVQRVKALQLGAIAAVRRRVRLPRPEETLLYSALANLREIEAFLPPTISQPPCDVPDDSFTRDGLYVRPRLVPRRQLYTMRVDLSLLHRRFSDVDAKKQAVHHHLVRFLSTVDDAVVSIVPEALVQHFGAYVGITLNLQHEIDNPASTALLVADEIVARTVEAFNLVPSISIAVGDAVVGNVGSFTAEPDDAAVVAYHASGEASHVPAQQQASQGRGGKPHQRQIDTGSSAEPSARSFKAFAAFGMLSDEQNMLSAISKLHDVPLVCSSGVMSQASSEISRAVERPGDKSDDICIKCSDRIVLRALELVTRVDLLETGNNAAAAPQRPQSPGGSSQNPADNARATSLASGGILTPQAHNKMPHARLAFEVIRAPTPEARDKERRRVQGWNKVLRSYTLGHLKQAGNALEVYQKEYGDVATCERLSKLLAAAAHVHGPGDVKRPSAPFVATYWEVLRDALVECA